MRRAESVTRRRIADSTFVIATNGFVYGPAQALREFLLRREALSVTFVSHPLSRAEPGLHLVTTEAGGRTTQRGYRVPNLVPYTHVLDPFIPLNLSRATAWFGFNNLAVLRGLAARRLGRVESVYYWAVDFVPARFGRSPLTMAFRHVDRIACMRSDARIELSGAALRARAESLALGSDAAPAITVPMGAWLDRTPNAGPGSWSRAKVVYLGHLVERQGVANLIVAMAIVHSHHPDAKLEIVGDGPESTRLRMLVRTLGLEGTVTFHGLVASHEDVERILAGGTLAAAPYLENGDNFTRFGDPGKLKAYLAAGLPIILTDVPPDAHELVSSGAASISGGTPEALATSIETLLSDQELWTSKHRSSLEHAKLFDWGAILMRGLGDLGWE